ncbi:MAG: hypothetical protein ACYS4W_06075 [Planctomycetota bacterium]
MEIRHLWDGYMGVLLFLAIRVIYAHQVLFRHISKRYPEEATVIRSYEWQMYPWSEGVRVARALIRRQSVSDPELARRANKAKRSRIYFVGWFVLGLIMFFVCVLFALAK